MELFLSGNFPTFVPSHVKYYVSQYIEKTKFYGILNIYIE